MLSAGRLFLICGPSGAGKDTLLDAARERLRGNSRVVFARRVITRPAEAGGEDHEALTPEAFRVAEKAGAFCLSWGAHGLRYGLRRDLEEVSAAGRDVVANVSRAVVAEARRRFARVEVLLVRAPLDVLAQRLVARGREDAAGIRERLERAGAYRVEGPGVHVLDNDGDLETVLQRFLAIVGQNSPEAPAAR